MLLTGLAGAVVARVSKPPPHVSMLLNASTTEPVVMAPVTRVKTTSVNMASVTPVRNLLRKGYAIDILSTGASRLLRPSEAERPERRRSALYMIAQVAPRTIARPESTKMEKFIFMSPKNQRSMG